MEFFDVMRSRISIRKYKDIPVEQEKIDELIDLMRIAPSAANRQEWKFVAVTDEEQLKKMRVACESRGPAMTAPLIFCICATEYEQMNDSGYNRGTIDASIASTYLHLATFGMGLGSCWVNRARQTFDRPEGKALLEKWGLPERYRGVGNCILGYADEEPGLKERLNGRIIKV